MHDTTSFKRLNTGSYRLFATISLLFCMQLLVPVAKAQEIDILDLLPPIIAAAVDARSCENGPFSTCSSAAGCRKIGGLFDGGVCRAKPEAHALVEQIAGKWRGLTALNSGTFYNYLDIDLQSLASLSDNTAYSLSGGSHSSNAFGDTNPNPVVASYDSDNQDWFILDFWGTDIGEVSILEVAQTRENQFDGCEFLLNYPDLTYKDGVCNRVRLKRQGEKPRFTAMVSNIITDFGNYLADLLSSAQGTSLDARVAEKRPSIEQIRGMQAIRTPARTPIAILSPEDHSSSNSSIVSVVGSVEETINLDRVELQGRRVFPSSNAFQGSVSIDGGSTIISASADYGRRTYTAEVLVSVDEDQPVVAAAVSTSSTSLVIQFNEPMSDDSISSTANFNIVRADNNGTLPVTAVEFADDSKASILLATGLQSDVNYTITVVNVTDQAGNTISGRLEEVEGDPSVAFFVGTAPTGDEVVDTDGDGLLDHVELSGWPVIVVRTDGTTETTNVSSDPFNADTDGDGVPDAEERHAGSDPRSNDSDGDTLSDYDEWNIIYSNPVIQDTDGDGIQDGFEYTFFKTSPILVDTDGDQIDDPTELAAGNRNPLVADLPSPDISIGNVNLQLDTRFTFTNEVGEVDTQSKTVEATLTQSEDDSFSSANETSTVNTITTSEEIAKSISVEVESGLPPSGSVSASLTSTVGTEQGSENGSTNSFGEESSRGSEEAYHDSLTVDVARDTRESISREVLGAAMKVDLRIANAGDIPFTISNLELTAQVQDPRDRRRLIPVASLTPENDSLGSINIGVLGDTDRGPFVFDSESVFPQEIQDLMKNPRGMIVQLANYDIVDEEGNNFAFSSQDVLDRTAGITFDLGDGRVESYRVATASEHDENTGEPLGISMARALEIIGLKRFATIRDGGNGISESTAGGDDVQLVFPGTTVLDKNTIISVGPDGLIDASTIVSGDDVLVESDYETQLFAASESIIDGGNGVVDTLPDGSDDYFADSSAALNSIVTPGELIIRSGSDGLITTQAAGDDIKVPGGVESEVLRRFRDAEASDTEFKFWVLYSSKDTRGVDLDDFRLRSGEQYDFALVQDRDLDGVLAREEYLYGTSDTLPNSDACDPNLSLDAQPACDAISDFDEIRTGWRVQLKTSPQSYRVYPNPNEGDSDRDGLTDDVELACGLDPRQRDTDFDGLNDREEIYGIRVTGPDDVGVPMESVRFSDPSHIPFFVTRYLGATPAPQNPPYSPDLAPNFVEHELSDACIAAIGVDGFATDPLDADTDDDFINDFDELSLGLHPNDKNDGGGFLDDDGDGLPNNQEIIGKTIVFNNGESAFCQSSPNRADTDGDKLPDLLEDYLGSNPCEPDTDGDGILDTDEYKNGGAVCVGNPPVALVHPEQPTQCLTFLDKPVEDYNAFVSACNEAEFCDVATIEGGGTFGLENEQQLGTNLNHFDTDADGHFDSDELIPGQRRGQGSQAVSNIADPSFITIDDTGFAEITDAFDPDSDNDGLLDGAEIYTYGSNPSNPFTDSDDSNLNDGQEVAVGRDPAFNDKLVTVTPVQFSGNTASPVAPTVFSSTTASIQNLGSALSNCIGFTGGVAYSGTFTISGSCKAVSLIVKEGDPGLTLVYGGTTSQFRPGGGSESVDSSSRYVVNYDTAIEPGVTLGVNLGTLPGTSSASSVNVYFEIDLNLD